MNVLATGAFQLNNDELAELEAAGHKVFTHPDERTPVERPERYEAVVCNGLFLYNPIERFTSLRLIQLTSAGLDRVPLDYIKEHNIKLYNASGVYSIPMAEFAVASVLQLYRKNAFFSENQRLHKWEKRRDLEELFGKNVCIVGCGSVGNECAKRFSAFGCNVVGIDLTEYKKEHFNAIYGIERLDETLKTADVVVLTLPLTEKTRHIIDKNRLFTLKSGAILVNIARGAVVDEGVIVRWLQHGGRAVLDVFEEEPLPETSPLWDMENVVLTPHNSFVGKGNRKRMWEKISFTLIQSNKV